MIDWWVNQIPELFPTSLLLYIGWLLCMLKRVSSDGGYIVGSIVESSKHLSPLQLLKLTVGFVGDRPIALFPFFLISYPFKSWLLHVCSWFGKDGMKRGGFMQVLCENGKIQWSHLFWPTSTPTSSPIQERWKEWKTRVGRVENGPALLPGLPEFGHVWNLTLQSRRKENSVAFPSHVDLSISSWARVYEENGVYPE